VNFFERQDKARGSSVRLVALFGLAVLSIVAVTDVVAAVLVRNGGTSAIVQAVVATSVITLLVIFGGTASKMVQLRAGGAAIAQSVGAVAVDPNTQDPALRRFANIVDEMAIASGVPRPRLFVLESEPSINAFAAGYTPADAAITVTAGALSTLNRDELQGVIGHEFSHILNGDMRLNVRLMGLLAGILLLGLVGIRLIAFGGNSRGRGGVNPVIVIALVATILGFVGQFFASIIKAGVGRQREWLADASSVQFTRQTNGLAGALKKIAASDTGSALTDTHAEAQINHMLFGEGKRGVGQLFATHPPLFERIKALEPEFQPSELKPLADQMRAEQPDPVAARAERGGQVTPAELAAVLVGAAAVPSAETPVSPAPPGPPIQLDPSTVSNRVGTFSAADLEHGTALSAQIPADVRQTAGQGSTAVPLLLALLLDGKPDIRANQLQTVATRLGAGAAQATQQVAAQAAAIPEILRLPVVGLAAPVVVARPREELDAVVATLDALVAADNTITLFEYCLTRLLRSYIHDAQAPAQRSKPGNGRAAAAQPAAITLLTAVAAAGNNDPAAAQRAYSAAAAHLLPGAPAPAYAVPPDLARALDAGWDVLDGLTPLDKQRLVESVVVAISDDGVVEVAEAELLRVTCALLHCPLPQLLG
jgi:Zn-dependent protease with chaperone function